MKLEFVAEGSPECPLVRVYGFSPSEVERLVFVLTTIAAGNPASVALHEMPGVEAISGCRLQLHRDAVDRGLVQLAAGGDLACLLTPDGWEDVIGLLEPFAAESEGFQWLSTCGDANWLISQSGLW